MLNTFSTLAATVNYRIFDLAVKMGSLILRDPPKSSGSGDAGASVTEGMNTIGAVIQTVVMTAGSILALFGILQVGISFSQHDAQQRINGFLFLAGGVLIAAAPSLLQAFGLSSFGS